MHFYHLPTKSIEMFAKHQVYFIIKKFLKKYPEFETVEIYIPENVKGTYDEVGGFTIDYNEDILDGFYIAKIRKKR